MGLSGDCARLAAGGDRVNTSFSRALGRLIRDRRDAAGIGQVELATKFGVTQSTVSKWERGRAVPDLRMMLDLADLLGITDADLRNVKAAA